MKLSSLITPDNIIISNEKKDKSVVLKEIVELVCRDLNEEMRKKVYDTIIKRENIQSTGIGYGVAIPHPPSEEKFKLEQILKMRFGIAVYKQGIDYKSLDKLPVYIVILTIAPEEEKNLYLVILSEIGKIFKNEQNRENIKNAETPEQVIQHIIAGESRDDK